MADGADARDGGVPAVRLAAQSDGRPRRSGRRGTTLSLKGRALRLLSGREHSRSELQKKLIAHEGSPGQLALVLDELEAKDFISESRVVESVVNRRASRFGAARIRHELLAKGLDSQRIADALQGLKASELDRARALWQTKFNARGDCAPTDTASRLRQMRFLLARGFGSEVVRRVVGGFDDS